MILQLECSDLQEKLDTDKTFEGGAYLLREIKENDHAPTQYHDTSYKSHTCTVETRKEDRKEKYDRMLSMGGCDHKTEACGTYGHESPYDT